MRSEAPAQERARAVGQAESASVPSVEERVEQEAEAARETEREAQHLAREIDSLRAQLEESFARARETGERLKETHDRLLRTAAEFDNFKKRAQKEKEDTRRFGIELLLRDFLPVADNLERALDHAEEHDLKQVIEGVRLVQKMLVDALAKHGVAGFSALGKPFDPTLHEALLEQESDSPAGTVVQEMARGYKLHDRLVRPAAVAVAKPRAASATASATPTANANANANANATKKDGG